MPPSTMSTSSRRPANILRWPSPFLPHAYDIPFAQLPLTWTSSHVLPSWQYSIQDAQLYCIHHSANHHSSHAQQHPPSCSKLVLISNACPQCQRQPKLPDHRFCSVACGQFAARSAPELKCLPSHHEMFVKGIYCGFSMVISRS